MYITPCVQVQEGRPKFAGALPAARRSLDGSVRQPQALHDLHGRNTRCEQVILRDAAPFLKESVFDVTSLSYGRYGLTALFSADRDSTFRAKLLSVRGSDARCALAAATTGHALLTQWRATMLAASKYVSGMQLSGEAAKSCVRNYV